MMDANTPQGHQNDEGFRLDVYLHALRRYLWVALTAGLVTWAAVAVWTFRQTKIYSATCSLEFDDNTSSPLGERVEDVSAHSTQFWMSREFFETQLRILSSRSLAEKVVETLGLQTDPEFRDPSVKGTPVEVAALELRRRVSAELLRGTRILLITASDENPERAKAIANAYAEEYIRKTLDDRSRSTQDALSWLTEQLDGLRNRLETSEMRLHDFKEEHNVLSVSMEDRQNLVSSEIERLSEALATARIRRNELAARLGRVSTAVNDPNHAAALGIETLDGLRQRLREKLAERERLAVRYGAAHPTLQGLDREIGELKAQIEEEIRGILYAAESDLREVTAIERGLETALNAAHEDGLELNLREIEFSRLQRQRQNDAKLYELVLERTTETDLSRMLRTTFVRVVDPALTPVVPAKPRLLTNLAAGGLLGLIAALFVVIGLERLDRRLRGISEVEQFGYPVLGVLPKIDTPEPATPSREWTPGPELHVHYQPMSSVAEQCRSIRTNLVFMEVDKRLRSIAVSSAEPTDGKTTVTCNLAIALAQSGKRVLVVDTDLRRPRVHKAFGLENVVGSSSILAGAIALEDAHQETDIDGLRVLTSGPIPPNPSELLHHERFGQLIKDAEAQFDYVLFDSPPVGVVTDASVIAPQVDGLVLVVKSGNTTRDALAASLRRVKSVDARIIGIVVNLLDPNTDGYGYRYGYRYGEKYGYSSHYGESHEDGSKAA